MERPDIKVLILAGGLGTRIRSLFAGLPKSMIPFGGKPFLEIQMRMLADQGFHAFVLCVGHQAEQIMDHFGDGQSRGWDITYSRELESLGTGGALHYAGNYLEGTFLLLNGDTWLPMDYRSLVRQHTEFKDGVATIVVAEMENTRRYGQVCVDARFRIQAFREKTESGGPGLVNAGVYVVEPDILPHIPAGQKISLERDTFPCLLAAGMPLYAVKTKQAFVDIGTPEGYRSLQDALG
jgi:mannose-1-phosphate guanylyltransferase